MQTQLSLFQNELCTMPKFPTTRYQGSKSKYVDWIYECIKDLEFHNVLDAFGGTGCVAYLMKEMGKQVTYNDILKFNYIIGKALIENNKEILTEDEVSDILACHNDIVYPTFIEDTFKNIYYTDSENRWLDVVSTNIRNIRNEYKQAIAYYALFQSCIIKRPYNLFHRKNLYVRQQDVHRSFGNKKTWDTPFEVHFRKFIVEANNSVFDNGVQCVSLNKDALNIGKNYDLVYIDTPYLNEKGIGVDYADFYHFLNGIVDYEEWATKIDYSSKHLRLYRQYNEWNDSVLIRQAFGRLFRMYKDSIMVISYRSNGLPTIEELVELLTLLGKKVEVHYSKDIKYALSTKKSNEVLIVAK